MTHSILCIIDMQPYFDASNEPWLLNNVLAEIKKAKKNNDYIIVLEYDGCGETHPDIIKACDGYNRYYHEVKSSQSGAPNIIFIMRENNIQADHFIIVGVETESCILETVEGIVRKIPKSKVTVVADAINSQYIGDYDHSDVMNYLFDKYSQVQFKKQMEEARI